MGSELDDYEEKSVVRRLREKKGWSQQTLADKTGIDQPKISYIEQGGRTPKLNEVFKLITACEFSPSQAKVALVDWGVPSETVDYLFNAVQGLLTFSNSGKVNIVTPAQWDHYIAMATNWRQQMYKDRIGGHSAYVIDVGDFYSGQLEELIRQAPTPGSRQKLAAIHGYIILETNAGEREIYLGDTLLTATEKRAQELYVLAKEHTLPEQAALGLYISGDVRYMQAQYSKSLPLITAASPGLKRGDDRLGCLHPYFLAAALLNDKGTLLQAQKLFDSTLASGVDLSDEQRCETYGGIARAWGIQGQETLAFAKLRDAWDLHEKMEKAGAPAPLRKLQLLRSEFELKKQFGYAKNSLLGIGQDALNFAKKLGNPRKIKLLEDALRDLDKSKAWKSKKQR